MSLRSATVASVMIALAVADASAQAVKKTVTKKAGPPEWPQWRGPNRDGVSSETGLLKQWPAAGPKMLGKTPGLGSGYSAVSVAAGRIYTMGDQNDGSYLYGLNAATGGRIWQAKVGRRGGNFEGTRCTPTFDDGRVYALGQFGDLVCVDAASGREVWRKNFESEFRGQVGGWNYCESPLIDGDKLVCTPGGRGAVIVALNKKTGAVIWKSDIPGERAEYSSLVISEAGGVRQYVGLLAGGVVGVAAADGKFLWRYDRLGNNTANAPTPVVLGDNIFASAGYGKGGALLKLSADGGGVSAQEVYYSNELKNKHGGVVVVGDHVYGGLDDSSRLFCADVKTGEVKWRKDRGAGQGSASLVYADGLLFVRYQDHVVTLVEATPEAYREKGMFRIPGGKREGWAHPVVCNGRLYLRNQDELLVYDVRGR